MLHVILAICMIFFAYVDPGLGLLAWQALIAFFVGLLFYVKRTRMWITQLFRRLPRPNKRCETPAAVSVPPPKDSLRR